MAFGTMFYSFGGAQAFPTIQHDMNNSSDFPKTVSLGFAGLYHVLFVHINFRHGILQYLGIP